MIRARAAMVVAVVGATASGAMAQAAGSSLGEIANPLSVVERAAESVPGFEGGLSGALNVLLLLTVLTLVPTIMIMCTCFVRFVIVLGLLKQALGTPSLPPPQVITALALFMTMLAMAPTLERINTEAVQPYNRGEFKSQLDMWNAAKQPVRDFMFSQIEASENWSSVYMIMNYRGIDTSEPESMTRADVDTLTLIPAYMLSELKVAFLMGFRVYLPFLIIDMVIASVLISMSMMMLPPVLISLPFKLLLFIMVDGWTLVVGSLLESVSPAGGGGAAEAAVSSTAVVGSWVRGFV
jgi:flagellar biosynthetic protein FliP